MENFAAELNQDLNSNSRFAYSHFKAFSLGFSSGFIFVRILHKNVPAKKQTLRFPNSSFLNKILTKDITQRLKYKNIYNRKGTDDNRANYKKRRTFCVKLLHKTENNYFWNLNIRNVLDNRKSWKTIKPYLSNDLSVMTDYLVKFI